MAKGIAENIDAIYTHLDKAGSPGCAVGVFRYGKALYQRGYGSARVGGAEKIGVRTVFNLGSVSKQFTAFCVHLLQERGKLSLEDGLLRHFPEMPRLYAPIKIKHLIRHRSGLRCIESLYIVDQLMGATHLSGAQRLGLLKRQKELNFRPGSSRMYCNSGYVLLAELVRRRSGLSLAAFAEREVFGPLGMRHSRILESHTSFPEGFATGHVTAASGIRPCLQGPATPGPTDVWSCVEDMALWDRNFFEGRVGSPRMFRRIFSPMPRSGNDYGGGFFLFKDGGRRRAFHGGYDSGFRAEYMRDLDSGYSAVTLCNLEGIDPYPLNYQALKVARGDAPKKRPAPARPAKAVKPGKGSQWAAFAGLYRSLRSPDAWTLSGIRGGLRVKAAWGGFDILELNGILKGQGIASESSFQFKGRPGPAARMIERKQNKIIKVFRFVGNPTWKIKDMAAYAGYYRSPETGAMRALVRRKGRLQIFSLIAPGAALQMLAPGRLMTAGVTADFKFDRAGRAREFTYDVPGGRIARLRFVKLPAGSKPFKLPGLSRVKAQMDKGFAAMLEQGI
jgi:CubicO group peptidase (beta-lactamase class C family)